MNPYYETEYDDDRPIRNHAHCRHEFRCRFSAGCSILAIFCDGAGLGIWIGVKIVEFLSE